MEAGSIDNAGEDSADMFSIIVKFMLMVMLESVSISARNSTKGDFTPRQLKGREREIRLMVSVDSTGDK